MIENEYAKSAVEINSIFNHMSLDLLNKIPKTFINTFSEIANKTDYKFEYDKSKKLNEQAILPKTKGFIALIYRDYLCDSTEKQNYNKKYYKRLNILNEEKIKKYNPDDLFKNNTQSNNISLNKNTSLPITYSKPSLFNIIIQKIKNFFFKTNI